MKNIYIGSEMLTVTDAVRNVQHNIDELKYALKLLSKCNPTSKIIEDFKTKLMIQREALLWLNTVLRQSKTRLA